MSDITDPSLPYANQEELSSGCEPLYNSPSYNIEHQLMLASMVNDLMIEMNENDRIIYSYSLSSDQNQLNEVNKWLDDEYKNLKTQQQILAEHIQILRKQG